jgi:L-rhamnose-H+ transport protein
MTGSNMTIFSTLLMTAGAGIINGSYAIPTKYVKRWSFESTWLVFSLVTFFLAPWLLMCWFSHSFALVWQFVQAVPTQTLLILAGGGFLFGIGQIGFAWALKRIGMGLAFVINISLSVALGSFLPLIAHTGPFYWEPTLFTIAGVMVILTGVYVCYRAGQARKSHEGEGSSNKALFYYGVIAAVVAGLGSAGQNFTYSLTHESLKYLALGRGLPSSAAITSVWPFFLTFAFIPYAIYMLFLNVKNKTFSEYWTAEKRYYLFTVLMMMGWYGSLILYSHAVHQVGKLGPVVMWPLFMSLIILTSNFWGWCYGEWSDASPQVKRKVLLGLSCFVIAFPLFGFATYLLTR